MTGRMLAAIKATRDALRRMLDLRDVFVFSGLALLGIGLWMLRPWLGLAVPGALLMALGLFWPMRIPRQ